MNLNTLLREVTMAKMRFRLTKLGKLDAGTRFWFAVGFFLGKEGTVIYQKKKGVECTGYHFGHAYDHKAKQHIGQVWRTVWVKVE